MPIAIGKEKDVEEKGEKEKNLEKYMEYVPDKREQEVRLMNMLKDQEKEEEVVIEIWTHLSCYALNSFTHMNNVMSLTYLSISRYKIVRQQKKLSSQMVV